MSEKKIDPKNPTTSTNAEASTSPTEDSRTSQRMAQRQASRVASRKVNRKLARRW